MNAWTVYTLGDLESIRGALTSIAMLFDSSNTRLWTGGGGTGGLGLLAGFGLLVSLAMALFGAVLKQKLELQGVLVAAVVYMALFVPKATLQIEDLYTGRVAVVGGVPVGIAAPAAITSYFTGGIANQLETVMRSANSSYVPQADAGFVQPLKMMLSLRRGGDRDPYLQKSYNFFITSCLPDNADLIKIQNATSPNMRLALIMQYIQMAGSGSNPLLTLVFSKESPNGELWACDEAAAVIEGRIQDLFSLPDSSLPSTPAQLTSIEVAVNGSSRNPQGGGVSEYGSYWKVSDLQNFASSVTGSMADSQQLLVSIAMADMERDAFRCGRSDGPDYIACSTAMAGAMEAWKIDAAGNGSLFQKTMIPMMNIMMFFFYAFAPIIAVVVMMAGMRGVVQILPKYMLFGVWTQTWIPAAVIINFYIQKQTQDQVQQLMLGNNGIPFTNMGEFFSVLTIKIGAASELLAAVPVITLSLLSGSIFALAGLAQRSSGDKFDEGHSAPKIGQNGAVATQAPMLADRRFASERSAAAGGGSLMAGADTNAGSSINLSNAFGYESSDALESAHATARDRMMSLSKNIGVAWNAGVQAARGQRSADGRATSDAKTADWAHNTGQNIQSTLTSGLAASEMKQAGLDVASLATNAAKWTAEARALGKSGDEAGNFVAGKVAPLLGGLGKAAKANIMSDIKKSTSKALAIADSEGVTSGAGARASLDRILSSGAQSSVDETGSKMDSTQLSKQFSEALKETDQLGQRLGVVRNAQERFGTSTNITPMQFGQMMVGAGKADEVLGALLQATRENGGNVGAEAKRYQSMTKGALGSAISTNDSDHDAEAAFFANGNLTSEQQIAALANGLNLGGRDIGGKGGGLLGQTLSQIGVGGVPEKPVNIRGNEKSLTGQTPYLDGNRVTAEVSGATGLSDVAPEKVNATQNAANADNKERAENIDQRYSETAKKIAAAYDARRGDLNARAGKAAAQEQTIEIGGQKVSYGSTGLIDLAGNVASTASGDRLAQGAMIGAVISAGAQGYAATKGAQRAADLTQKKDVLGKVRSLIGSAAGSEGFEKALMERVAAMGGRVVARHAGATQMAALAGPGAAHAMVIGNLIMTGMDIADFSSVLWDAYQDMQKPNRPHGFNPNEPALTQPSRQRPKKR